MGIKQLAFVLGKSLLGGVAFFTGMVITGMTLPRLGFQPPAIPAGTDANSIAFWFFAGSIIVAFVLSFVTTHLRATWYVRWMLLFSMIWVIAAACMVIESIFFIKTGAVASLFNTLHTLLSFLLPSLFLSGALTLLFRPGAPEGNELAGVLAFVHSRKSSQWLWRATAVWLAYPPVYFAFGLLVEPFIREFYTQSAYELTLPSWGQLILLQLVRSLLLLLVCLPIAIVWRGSKTQCWLALSFSVFALSAFMAVMTSYWFPWQLRLYHGIELWLDALIYTGILVILLRPGKAVSSLRAGQTFLPRKTEIAQVSYTPN